MANNRLYLVHRPSGQSVMLGKRMAHGWYSYGDLDERITAFFESTAEGRQDDFMLAMEDESAAPMAGGFTAFEDGKPVGFYPHGKK